MDDVLKWGLPVKSLLCVNCKTKQTNLECDCCLRSSLNLKTVTCIWRQLRNVMLLKLKLNAAHPVSK